MIFVPDFSGLMSTLVSLPVACLDNANDQHRKPHKTASMWRGLGNANVLSLTRSPTLCEKLLTKFIVKEVMAF